MWVAFKKLFKKCIHYHVVDSYNYISIMNNLACSSVGKTLEEFKTSVTVAAHQKVTFELTYEELLKRRLGEYELQIHARPMQPVNDFKVGCHCNMLLSFWFFAFVVNAILSSCFYTAMMFIKCLNFSVSVRLMLASVNNQT